MAGANDWFTRTGTGARTGETPLTATPPLVHILALLIAATLLWPFSVVVAEAQGISDCLAAVDAPTPVTAIHVQPGAGYTPVVDEINNARCTIDLSMYLFTSDEIVAALKYAELRGVRVRVILEEVPFGFYGAQEEIFDELVGIGADVKWSPQAFQFSHAKYMIVDANVLLVTNQNFTGAGFNSNREFGVVTTERGYVVEAAQIFESDWHGAEAPTSFQHLVVSPANSRSVILQMINNSRESVWLYAEVLRDEEITQALDDAVNRGVDVRLLVNPSTSAEDAPYFLDVLDHGVQVRVLNAPYVHSKALIVDRQQVLVGSQNYSFTSLDRNREVGIVLTDPVTLEVVSSTFLSDWSRAEPVDTLSWREKSVDFP